MPNEIPLQERLEIGDWRGRGRVWKSDDVFACPGGDYLWVGHSFVEVWDGEKWKFWHDDCAENAGFYD